MKPSLLAIAPFALSIGLADTIRLKDGTEFEGYVLSEEGGEYLVAVQVTKTIRDQRKIPKADVLEIIAEKKDELAYEKIKDLVPTPDLLELEDYDKRIEAVEDFIEEFGSSSLAEKASEMLKTLDQEREVIREGGVKFEDEMIPGDERDQKAYTLDSEIAASKVEKLASLGQKTQALRAWEELQSGFPTSRAYLDTIPLAIKLMQSLQTSVESQLATLDERLKKRADGIARIPEKDRARSQQAIDEVSAAYERRVAQEKEAGIKWLSLDPFHKEPLNATQTRLRQEIQRLERLDTAQIPDGDNVWRESWETLSGSPTMDEARKAVSNARSARLPEPYLKKLEAKMPSN